MTPATAAPGPRGPPGPADPPHRVPPRLAAPGLKPGAVAPGCRITVRAVAAGAERQPGAVAPGAGLSHAAAISPEPSCRGRAPFSETYSPVPATYSSQFPERFTARLVCWRPGNPIATWCFSTPAGVISHISLDTFRTGSPAQHAR